MSTTVESEMAKLFVEITEKYGFIGASFVFLIWYVKSLGEKIDKLSNLSQRTYGAIMASIDKDDRNSITTGKEGDDV